MVESTIFWDGFGKGLPGDDSFDNIMNILDFPIESLKEDNSDDIEDFQLLGPIPLDIFQGFSTPPSQATGKPGFQPNDHVWSDETSDKKQLLEVTEISSISIPTDSSHGKELSLSQTPSPVSVLERMSTSPELLVPVRTRSKRRRHLTFTKWPLITLVNPSEKKGKEMKKRKLSHFSNVTEVEENSSSQRCSHCQVTKTPLWREGPMGPKTLCNACGVRYRSGCLFPEYRPAASPTFVPTLHSNSHKKVIQMRDESIQKSFR